MAPEHLLALAQRLQAISQTGLHYGASPYDLERYHEVQEISAKLLQELTGAPFEKILKSLHFDSGYQTPKVDVRAVIVSENRKILLVKENIDAGRWTLPGGWADVGLSPFENVVKEAREETGLLVKPIRLLALLDKDKYPHPPQPWYVYKAFIHCEVEGGTLLRETAETSGAEWFEENDLSSLELSADRIAAEQLQLMFEFIKSPDKPAACD